MIAIKKIFGDYMMTREKEELLRLISPEFRVSVSSLVFTIRFPLRFMSMAFPE